LLARAIWSHRGPDGLLRSTADSVVSAIELASAQGDEIPDIARDWSRHEKRVSSPAPSSAPPSSNPHISFVMSDSPFPIDIAAILSNPTPADLEAAEAAILAEAAEAPGDARILNRLALVSLARGKFRAAQRALETAVALAPDQAELHHNLGRVLAERGDRAAAAAFQRATALKPDLLEAHCGLAATLRDQRQFQDAYHIYLWVSQQAPQRPEAYSGMGAVLQHMGQIEKAIEAFGYAVAASPPTAQGHVDLADALKEQGNTPAAIASYREALRLYPGNAAAMSRLIYCLSFTRSLAPPDLAAMARDYGRLITPRERDAAPPPRRLEGHERLRVAFVSAEIGQHAVSYFLESYLRNYDRAKVHLTLYATTARRESRHAELCALADDHHDISRIEDDDAFALIREHAPDVLVHTSGHMRGHRLALLARRCAPVQCEYIGYHGTTGIAAMDYLIGDDRVTPPEHDGHFTEKVWRLPHVWMTYHPSPSLPAPRPRPDDGELVFGGFHNLARVGEDCLDIWARVLRAVPHARLLLKDAFGVDSLSARRVTAGLVQRGVAPDRITFLDREPDWTKHMALYNEIDLALDTLPLNGGTTSFDALVMATPVITLPGDWIGGRSGLSILTALGRPEWIAATPDELAAIAARLARDPVALRRHKTTLRAEVLASPLCDGRAKARVLDAAFLEMHRLAQSQHCR
jgi:predicted O-linked N-acetylglucosamine transferase (SPINDLY family)